MTRKHFKSKNKSSRRNTIIVIVISVIAVMIAFWGMMSLNKSASNTKKSHNVASSRSASGKKAKTTHKQTSLLSVLPPFTEEATEDPDTRTGNDTTYSQFYQKAQNWYWKFSSINRGTIEVGKISNFKQLGKSYILSVSSQLYEPGTHYKLNLHWLTPNKKYNVHTDFKSINGNYTFGTNKTLGVVNTRNLTRPQIRDWIMRNIAKYATPKDENNTFNWRYYYWKFSRNKNGCVNVFVTENHDYANRYGADVDPEVAPTVGSFEITKEGYLKAYSVGTSGITMVNHFSDGESARSAIVATSFDE